MIPAPPARAPQIIRRSPANGEALLHARYDLRAADGLRLCSVSREAAERQIAAGTVELVQGRAGAYLRPVGLAPPEYSRLASVSADSRKALPDTPPRGAIRPEVYTSRHAACGRVGFHRARRVGPPGGIAV
jgi:hypothetical protein